MSKRGQATQGGEERYGGGFNNGPGEMTDRPQQANAAQMARRKIAQVKKTGASARSSRANTPNANPFAPQQQSMASFQMPQQGDGSGGSFNFSVNAASNPFQNANGASGTPPPSFGANQQQQQQQNGGGGLFGNNSTSFGSTFGSNTPAQPQSNGFNLGQNNNMNGSSTPSFGFGQNNQSQAQQNGATPASNTLSFNFGQTNGGTNNPFQFGQSQPQTQSTQGTPFSFGQTPQTNGEKAATPSFGGFNQGTQQQASEKPATPSFSFGQSTQPAAEKPATPSFGSFSQPKANGDKAPIFGGTPQPEQAPKPSGASLFTFNSQNQGIGNKTIPEAASKPAETPKAPMSNLFSAQKSTGTGLFGSTPPPRESSATPKPGDSIFSTQSKPKLGGNLFTSDMAEGEKPKAPAPMFGQPAKQNGESADADKTPKPNNFFGGFGQSQNNAVQDTPKPSSNLFSASNFGQTPAQPASASKNLFNQSIQDTSMNSPGSTPQKSSLFAPAASQQPERSASQETPAAGKSLFDRISRASETSDTARQEAEKPSFEQSAAPTPAAPATAQKSFTPSTDFFNTAAPQSKPTSDLFGKQSEQAAAPPAPKAPSFGVDSSISQSKPASQPTRTSSAQKSSSSLAEVIPENEKKTLKVLNEGLMAHIAKQDPSADWTTIMEYYLQQAAIIRNKPVPNLAALSAAPAVSQSAKSPVASSASTAAEAPQTQASFGQSQPPAPKQSTSSNIFGSASAATPKGPSLFQRTSSSDSQQTPKPSFLQPPATAPVNRKRSAEDDAEKPPATEKRAKPSESTAYPKLPDNASNVSKAFYNALENKSAGTSLFSTKNGELEKAHEAPAASGFKPTAKPATGGFTPSASGFTPSTSGFMPSSSGFTPSMPSSGSNNFLAAFGKKASEQQEMDRQKRKDDDYDSEDETEEQWAERDRKEQEAKRAKVLEASKGSGFVFKAAAKPAEKPAEEDSRKGSLEKEDDETAQEKPAESTKGKSLFDRISYPSTTTDSPSLFSGQTPAAKTSTSNIFGSSATPASPSIGTSLFGHLSKSTSNGSSNGDKGETVEKQTQGTGDNTWKQSTPIKFGNGAGAENGSTTPAAPPPAFGNLFGPKTQSSSSSNGGLLGVPGQKQPMGFNFGGQSASVTGSRATTPGVTTDGEGTGASTAGEGDNEPSDDPPAEEAQVEDMTGLSDEEIKNETLLHTVAMSKASKWEEKKNNADPAGGTHGWIDKGKGPLYLLKNNETGKTRILLKVPPYGAAKMNFPVLKGGGYETGGKTGKQITGTFYDHLADKPGLGKWLIAVGKKQDADEVSRILKEGMPE